jgi:hypothetical protein
MQTKFDIGEKIKIVRLGDYRREYYDRMRTSEELDVSFEDYYEARLARIGKLGHISYIEINDEYTSYMVKIVGEVYSGYEDFARGRVAWGEDELVSLEDNTNKELHLKYKFN